MADGYARERVDLGRVAETFRLTAPGRPTLYLKVAAGLEGERARLDWAAGRLPVPRVVRFDADGLLLTEVPGVAASLLPAPPVRALVEGLRLVHGLPVADCPFDARFATRLAEAALRVAAGLVDEDDFDDERRGRSARDVLAELRALGSPEEDLVVAHGDFTLDNVIVTPDGALAGLVDLGRLGVADRWQDLALVTRGLGAEAAGELLARYGAPGGAAKAARYRLLDELF